MEEAALIRAILDEPEDDVQRLIFADWLLDQGQDARSDWIRLSCRLAGIHSFEPAWHDLIRLVRDRFERCRPAWWQEVTGVVQHNHRGMFRFEVGSKTAAARLGKVPWVGDAVAGGWLEQIQIRWCDGSLARVLAGWKGAVREVPLTVHPAPQIGDEGLRFYLEVPHLWSLVLPAKASQNPSITKLGERTDLRELKLEGVPDDPYIAPVYEQIGRLTRLRRLVISAHSRPNDEDLRSFGGMSGLRELSLERCVTLTAGGLSLLLESLKGLRRLELNCHGVSAESVSEMRVAFPALRIEQG